MRNSFILSFILTINLITISCVSAETYPFVGVTAGENVHIRSGQSENFESLGMLAEDQKILVLEKKYSWYKVQLPPNFNLYLSEDFVLVHNNGLGEVLGNRINVRARPSLTATVVTQVSKEDTVKVEQVEDGWCQIKPLIDTYGWINEEYIKFFSDDTASYTAKPVVTVAEIKAQEERKIKEAEAKKKAELLAQKREEERRKISIRGRLKDIQSEYDGVGNYKIITDSNLTYILDEDTYIYDPFVDLMVIIDAKIISFSDNKSPYPVIKINKIQLVL